MEKLLIFMYRYWLAALFISLTVACGCLLLVNGLGLARVWKIWSFLPFLLTVSVYYASMLFVRKRYSRKDEVRYRAHYLRTTFALLTLIGWFAVIGLLALFEI